MNLSQLRDRAMYRARDITNIVVSPDVWTDHLNFAYMEFLSSADFPLEIGSTDITFTTADGELTLGTDVFKVLNVLDITNDIPLVPITNWAQIITEYPDIDQTGRPEKYRVTAGAIRLFPKQDTSVTIRVTHYKPPPAMVDDLDEPVLPLRYQDAIVAGAVAKSYRDDQNYDSEKVYQREFDRIVRNAKDEWAGPIQGSYTPLPRTPRSGQRRAYR